MNTEIGSFGDREALDLAVALLLADEVIAAATDTVYGVMCRFDSADGIRRLYEVKDRPVDRAIPVLIGDIEQLTALVAMPISTLGRTLMAQLWPGALTLVLPALDTLSPILTATLRTVAVRMPDHAGLRQLLRVAGPVAATSANISGQPETRSAAQVLAQLGGRIRLILEDPRPPSGAMESAPSTIVDVSGFPLTAPRILRAGPRAAEVRAIIEQVPPC